VIEIIRTVPTRTASAFAAKLLKSDLLIPSKEGYCTRLSANVNDISPYFSCTRKDFPRKGKTPFHGLEILPLGNAK
jgi:hypothetical protein